MKIRDYVIQTGAGFLHQNGKNSTENFDLAYKFRSMDEAEEYRKKNIKGHDWSIQSYVLKNPK